MVKKESTLERLSKNLSRKAEIDNYLKEAKEVPPFFEKIIEKLGGLAIKGIEKERRGIITKGVRKYLRGKLSKEELETILYFAKMYKLGKEVLLGIKQEFYFPKGKKGKEKVDRFFELYKIVKLKKEMVQRWMEETDPFISSDPKTVSYFFEIFYHK